MKFQEMESHLAEAESVLDEDGTLEVAIAHSLLVLAECAYRRELRES